MKSMVLPTNIKKEQVQDDMLITQQRHRKQNLHYGKL